jgi:hypothetical protein
VLLGIAIPIILFAANSENFGVSSYVFNSAGDNSSVNSTTFPGDTITLQSNVGESFNDRTGSSNHAVQVGLFNDFFVLPPTPTVTPTATMTPTITVTTTPIRSFGGELLDKQYVYAAPNPIRGSVANIYYDLAQPADVEIKIYTTGHRLVISKNWSNMPAGKNYWAWNESNMANGVYLMLITAKNQNKTTKLVKKLAIIK